MPERRYSGKVEAINLSGAFVSQTAKAKKQRPRHCGKDGCRTVLSVYNTETRCSLHATPKVRTTVVDSRVDR